MAQIEIWRRKDLESLVHTEYLDGSMFDGDADGNLFGIELYKNGEAYNGGGSVSANVIRADGGTVAVTGSISGNKASVVLPAACFAVNGPIVIVIKLTVSSVITTIGAFASSIDRSSTGTTIDPGTIIPSIQSLISAIETAVESIPLDYASLDKTVEIYASLTNDGQYTIKSSDLESGYWAYSTKNANSKRLRNKVLIPVRKGMAVKYSNPTMKIYFGVLKTPTSGSYIQLTGWINAGKENEVLRINYDGYMTFIVESEENITVADYDSDVDIFVKAYTDGKQVTIAGAQYPFARGSFNTTYNVFNNVSTRIHTDFLAIPQGNYEIKVGEGFAAFVAVNDSNETYTLFGGELTDRIVIPVLEDYTYAIIVRRKDDGILSVFDDTGLTVSEYIPKELSGDDKIELLNIKTRLKYVWPFIDYSQAATEITKMPKGGICVGTDRSDGSTPFYRVNFFRMEDNVFVPADDYEYAGVDWEDVKQFQRTSAALYFPYDDNLYFQVFCATEAVPYIRIGYETERHGYGRLLTLGMIGMSFSNGVPTPSFRNYTGSYRTSQYLDGSVVRLEDVKRIVCTPKYSLSAWIYDSDDNLIKAVYGGAMVAAACGGVNEIDLSEYNGTDGYAVIVVMGTQTRDGSTTNSETMGCLARHDDVMNNVFVEYTNKTVIWHKPGMNPIIGRNIETLKGLRFPKVFAHNYRGNWTSKNMKLDEMHDMSLGFYNGSAVADVPLSNITMKSYATAVKNVNSRVYVGNWITPNPGATTFGYGMICANLPQILCGIEESTDSFGFWIFSDYMGHETEAFDLTNCAEKLKPGDWMHGRTTSISKVDYHVGLVTDVIYVNGAPFCVEYIESYPAMLRYRYMYLMEPYRRFDREYSDSEASGDYYCLLSRPPASALSLWQDKWDLDIDYTVGALRCDRGTDSVYCMGNKFCYITLAGDSIAGIDVYVGGIKKKTIMIADRQKVTLTTGASQAIDIISDIRECGAGYYQLKLKDDSAVQESFYVPSTPDTATIELTDEGRTYTITPDDSQEILQIWTRYFARDSGEEEEDETDYYYNPDTGEWEEIEVPHGGEPPIPGKRYINMCWRASAMEDGKFVIPVSIPYIGYNFYFDYCNIVYKTNYGTFCYGRDIGYDADYPIEWCNSDRDVVNTSPIT